MDISLRLQQIYLDLENQVSSLPLAETPEDIVPGEGNAQAEVMFIGEAPGANEQLERRPFVGRSGKFLRAELDKIGIPPESVYITSIVKARPPENRDPTPAEISAYKPYLDREIEIVSPKLIVTLGRFSMAHFLPNVRISEVHGQLHEVIWREHALLVLPLYHPAAALRSTHVKANFVQDLQKILEIIGI